MLFRSLSAGVDLDVEYLWLSMGLGKYGGVLYSGLNLCFWGKGFVDGYQDIVLYL